MLSSPLDRLNEALSALWFEKVGQPVEANVSRADSWEEAYRCSTKKFLWENSCISAANETSAVIRSISVDAYNSNWNVFARTVRPIVVSFSDATLVPLLNDNGVVGAMQRTFLNSIGWNLVHLAIEDLYRDLLGMQLEELTFFRMVCSWYQDGHLPCGWDGDYPSGRLVIF